MPSTDPRASTPPRVVSDADQRTLRLRRAAERIARESAWDDRTDVRDRALGARVRGDRERERPPHY